MSQIPTLILVSSASLFLPLVAGLVMWSKLAFNQRILVILVAISAIIQVGALIMGYGLHVNNISLFHLFTWIEFPLLVFIYQRSFPNLLAPVYLITLMATYWTIGLIDAFYLNQLQQFPTLIRTIESILVIGMTVYYFYQMLLHVSDYRLERNPLFWISSGLLIYFTCNLMLFAWGNFIFSRSPEFFNYVWMLHAVFNILLYLFYTLGIICRKPTPS